MIRINQGRFTHFVCTVMPGESLPILSIGAAITQFIPKRAKTLLLKYQFSTRREKAM